MTSADFLQFVVTTKKNISPARPPRVSVITFTSYVCYIYTLKFGQYWTLFCIGNSSVSSMPYMQFLFVRPRFCLQLLSDSASRRTPLSSANSSYCQACSGLSPPSYYACRAHYKKHRSAEICRRRFHDCHLLLALYLFVDSGSSCLACAHSEYYGSGACYRVSAGIYIFT